MTVEAWQRRKARAREVAPLYQRAHVERGPCVYCGAACRGVDHVPPVCVVAAAGAVEGAWLYDACPVCNYTLGDYPVSCLDARAGFLLGLLRREYLFTRGGRKRRFSTDQFEAAGRGLKARIDAGEVAARCRCKRCRESKTPGPCGPGAGAG
jgi:hypothetical protein